MDEEDYRGALEFLESVEYENSADLAAKCHYELGRISHLAGKTDEAVAEYAYAVSLPEACSALLSAAKDYSVINEPEKAIQTLWLIREQEDAQNELTRVAATASQNGKIDVALLAYSTFEVHPEIDFVELYQGTSYDSFKESVGNCLLLSDSLEFKEFALYQFADMARNNGLYDTAISAYSELDEYSDAAMQVNETKYQKASALEAGGDQADAAQLFISLDEYRDSFERANKAYYDLGVEKREAGEWDAAVAAFKHAGIYSDAPTQILATRYAEGEAKRAAQDWDGAVAVFEKLGNYNDSATQIVETRYQEASALEAEGKQEAAHDLFLNLGEYNDSFERAKKPYYELGVVKREAGEWDDAVKAFEKADTYLDAKEQIPATRYAEGEAKRAVQDWDGAIEAFSASNSYEDSDARILECNYLWMAMNGLYGYLSHHANQYATKPKKRIKNEWQEHDLMCALFGMGSASMPDRSREEKNRIMQDAMSLLRKSDTAPDELYECIREGQKTSFTDKLEAFFENNRITMEPYPFFCVWLPYQIRCKYFHANAAIPLFSYADEPIMGALLYTNCFVKRFVEEHLPFWLMEKTLPEEQSRRIEEAYKRITG